LKPLAVVLAVVLAAIALYLLPIDAILALLFGWVQYLYRVFPRITVDRGSGAVGAAAIVLFTAGVHAAGRSWRRRLNPEARPVWRLRWTLALVLVVVLLFASGIALVGITHQVAWLATSPEPLRIAAVQPRWVRHSSVSNLKSIGIAAHSYHGTYGSLPPGGTFTPQGDGVHSWETRILVFLGWSIKTIDQNVPWNVPRNANNFQGVLPDFINPDLQVTNLKDPDGFGLSHYSANVWLMGPDRGLKLDHISDGTANTILAGEVNAHFKPWGHPVNWRDPARGINRSPFGFGGAAMAGGAHFAMADGSARFVSENVSPAVLEALATLNGGEDVDPTVLEPR
jgi:hypothetical protein